jgi:hypothetical protein
MNDRVPDSSGLPLRAMVMVLLFLGVIFLLVGFQAMGSGNDSSSDDTATRTVTTTTSKPPAPAKADVRVFNVGEGEGAASRIGDRLREAGWNVTDTSNLQVPSLPATTVYYGTTEGEQAAAESVGKVLNAPVAPRIPEIAEQPPGVIVLVTG